jgi:hypothetical protein
LIPKAGRSARWGEPPVNWPYAPQRSGGEFEVDTSSQEQTSDGNEAWWPWDEPCNVSIPETTLPSALKWMPLTATSIGVGEPKPMIWLTISSASNVKRYLEKSRARIGRNPRFPTPPRSCPCKRHSARQRCRQLSCSTNLSCLSCRSQSARKCRPLPRGFCASARSDWGDPSS